MEINDEVAEGIQISGKDFDYVYAERKPNAEVKIVREIWFRGKARQILNKLKEEKQNGQRTNQQSSYRNLG